MRRDNYSEQVLSAHTNPIISKGTVKMRPLVKMEALVKMEQLDNQLTIKKEVVDSSPDMDTYSSMLNDDDYIVPHADNPNQNILQYDYFRIKEELIVENPSPDIYEDSKLNVINGCVPQLGVSEIRDIEMPKVLGNYFSQTILTGNIYCGSKRQFSCHQCSAEFTSPSALAGHICTRTGEKLFCCHHCDAKFALRRRLTVHLRYHTDKPFSCGHCNAKFAQRSHLKVHIRSHTGEKPFSCGHCNAKFTQRSHLNVHVRSHTGEKPFRCDHCNVRFTRRGNLTKHIKRIHQ